VGKKINLLEEISNKKTWPSGDNERTIEGKRATQKDSRKSKGRAFSGGKKGTLRGLIAYGGRTNSENYAKSQGGNSWGPGIKGERSGFLGAGRTPSGP